MDLRAQAIHTETLGWILVAVLLCPNGGGSSLHPRDAIRRAGRDASAASSHASDAATAAMCSSEKFDRLVCSKNVHLDCILILYGKGGQLAFLTKNLLQLEAFCEFLDQAINLLNPEGPDAKVSTWTTCPRPFPTTFV